ncbi:hypothetical protein, partial [Acinetobacter baumannii]|uniref:hypothetical protein n=1 Tax=Acinetobacter baumannii TaxID=470 RepID=UPI00148C95E2
FFVVVLFLCLFGVLVWRCVVLFLVFWCCVVLLFCGLLGLLGLLVFVFGEFVVELPLLLMSEWYLE